MTNFDGNSPIYRQIAEQVSDEILRGTLVGDQQVPSTNQYALHHRINPATVARAFQSLVEDGLLYKRRGIGMFVAPDARERLRTRHRDRFFEEVVGPVVVQAQVLGIPLDHVVAHIRSIEQEEGP